MFSWICTDLSEKHPQVEAAAEFLFSCQTPEGDLRGISANQYATYYTGAIMSTLIQAGYYDDPRIERGFQWLLAMRQDDGGWINLLLTHKLDRETTYRLTASMPTRSSPVAFALAFGQRCSMSGTTLTAIQP